MKSHIAGSNLPSKENIQEAVAHRNMKQVLIVYELCEAIALNEVFGFGNERLRKVEEYKQQMLIKFDRYASSTGTTRAKGYTDYQTGIEWLLQVAKSRNIDISAIGYKKID